MMIQFEAGKDYVVDDESQLPFQLRSNLGFGHSGNVEEVQDVTTGAVFARKMTIIKSKLSRAEKERIFWNEVKIIRGFDSHHHTIRVFATYIAKRTMGIILDPVADHGDLTRFLEYAEEHRTQDALNAHHLQIIDRAFGCLASGLAFMHQKRIRHKDIKPQNILVHQGIVIYTDFGYSLDHNQLSQSTTEGKPDSLTRRYAAPEVLKSQKRNSSSDVFSLGCVYLELLAVRLNDPVLSPGSKTYADHVKKLHHYFESLQGDEWARFFLSRIKNSVAYDKQHRPKAEDLAAEFLKWDQFSCSQCRKSTGAPAPTKAMEEEGQQLEGQHLKGQEEGRSSKNPTNLDPVVGHAAENGWIHFWSNTDQRYYRAKEIAGQGWVSEWLPKDAVYVEADSMDVDAET